MTDDLDAETLVTLSILMEIENQCQWGLTQMDVLRERIAHHGLKGTGPHNWQEFHRNQMALFGAIQAFLTCAGIVDSLLTGRGPPPPKGKIGLTPEQRATVRQHLALPTGFEVGGRVQRNSLVHIEERLIPWSRPGGMRADFGFAGIDPQHPEVLRATLRIFDPATFKLSVVGDVCNLAEVENSLHLVRTASNEAHQRILDEVNARLSDPS